MSIKLQESTVIEVASLAPAGWSKITVNIEIDDVDDELVLSPQAFYYNGDSRHELRLGIDATDYFEELRQDMAENDGNNRAWTVCDLEINPDGKFNFRFSYDEPQRLSALKG